MRSVKRKNYLFSILFVLIFIFFLFANAKAVFALEINYPYILGTEPPQVFMEKIRNGQYGPEEALPFYVKYIYNLLLTIGGLVAFGALVYGGFLTLISGESASKALEGRSFISSALLGLIILFSSYIILETINPELLVLKLPQLRNPNFQYGFRKKCGLGRMCIRVAKTSATETDECTTDYDCPEETEWYAEVPYGLLIDSVRVKSENAKYWAEQIWRTGAETDREDGASSVAEISNCLNHLANEHCSCDMQTYGCSGDDCTGTCRHPCDREDISTNECLSFGVADLCQGVNNEPFCRLGDSDPNTMDVITKLTNMLQSMNTALSILRQNAIIANKILDIENQKLKLAEHLMRNSYYTPISFHKFASIEHTSVAKIDIWQNINLDRPQALGGVYGVPPLSCSRDKSYEIIPSCTLCQDVLFCYGNDYRNCAADPSIDGLRSEGRGRNAWFSPSTFGAQVLYNSLAFPVPTGGVYVCGNNVYGCVNWRCKATSEKIFEDDAAKFYVPVKNNEDLIKMVELATFDDPLAGWLSPPPIDPNWAPPPYPDPNDPIIAGYIPTEERIAQMLECAQLARRATGVRASLILALMWRESGYSQFPGGAYYPDAFCSAGQRINFETIWEEVEPEYQYPFAPCTPPTDVDCTMRRVPLSGSGIICPPGDVCERHCGGAMGPAQAMPSTWQGLKERVRDLIRLFENANTEIVSPWEFNHACVFAGAFLAQIGADSQKCVDEAYAVFRYVGAHLQHAQNVVTAANMIAQRIGENACIPSSPIPPGPGNISWQLPIPPERTVLSSNAQDHTAPGRNSYWAWDLTAPCGTEIHPARPGTISYAGCGGTYGCWVEVDHGGGWKTRYAHLISGNRVSVGTSVTTDTVIGQIGCTGLTSFGPHTHFQMYRDGQLQDPQTIYGDPSSIGLPYRPFCRNGTCTAYCNNGLDCCSAYSTEASLGSCFSH